MSIVGTRPPLPNEWEAYELHHRARLPLTFLRSLPVYKDSLS